MTGDELPYPILSRHIVEAVVGDRLDDDLKVEEIVAELQHSFHPFFLIPDQARRRRCERRWRDLLGDNTIVLDEPSDVCFASAGIIALTEGFASNLGALEDVYKRASVPAARIGPILQALTPYAESIGRTADAGGRVASFIRSIGK